VNLDTFLPVRLIQENSMYTYLARVTKVYDGDTLTCDIDLGFNMWMRAQKIRLADIDAPELVGPCRPAGLAARNALRELVAGKDVILLTRQDKAEKYGRWLGEIWLPGSTKSVNHWLVEAGHAKFHSW